MFNRKKYRILCFLAFLAVLSSCFFIYKYYSNSQDDSYSCVDSDYAYEEQYVPEEIIEAPLEPRIVIHSIKKGETLSSIWSHYTANNQGAIFAAAAFKDAKVPLSVLKAGDELELQISIDNDITALRKRLDKGRTLLLDGDSFSGYHHRLIEPVYTESEKVITGTISSSLFKDAVAKGVPVEVIDSFVDLLASNIDFRRDLQEGDTFSVSFTQQQTKDGEIINTSPIKNASMFTKGKLHVAIGYVGQDNKRRYYDADGVTIGNYFLRYPLKFSRISSVFSKSRQHPVLGIKRPHLGIDFAAPTGTPVRSIGSGKITFIGTSGQAGRMIKIQHNQKYASAYLHLSGFKKGLKQNSSVERGEVIGYVGSTGLATGPHLDFRFAINGEYVDPLKANLPQISNSTDVIPQKILKETLEELKQIHQSINNE